MEPYVDIQPTLNPDKEYVDLFPTDQIPVSDTTANDRSFKMKYALGDILQKSQEEIFQGLLNGDEPVMRQQAASDLDLRKRVSAQNAVIRLTQSKGQNLTFEESEGIRDIVMKLSRETKPEHVMEEAYAQKYLAYLDQMASNNPDSIWHDAKRADPKAVIGAQDKGTDLFQKREIAHTVFQDLRDKYKAQGYGEFAGDILIGVLPFVSDYLLRTRSGKPFFDNLLGGNFEENLRKELYRLPPDEFGARVKEIASALEEESLMLAMSFVKKVIGMSSEDVWEGNITTGFDVAGLALGRTVAKTVSGVAETVRAARGTEKTQAVADAEKAVSDMVKAGANPEASVSTIQDAAGNLKEAAVTKLKTNLATDFAGASDVTKRGVQQLTSNFDVMSANVKTNPGRASQELVNRVSADIDSHTSNLMRASVEAQKLERVPAFMGDELAVRAAVDEAVNKYPWMNQLVLDKSKVYKDELSGTRFVDIHLGAPGAQYYDQRSVAENFMTKYGIAGKVEKGTEFKFSPTLKQEEKLRRELSATQALIDRHIERLNDPNISAKSRAKSEEQIAVAREYISDKQAELAKMTGVETYGFKTAKGSEYVIQKDGTTIRNKAARPEHPGDSGVKPKSVKTVYVTPEQAQALAPPQGRWKIVDSKGKLSTVTPTKDNRGWGVSASQRDIPYSTTPEKGLVPVELWKPQTVQGRKGFAEVHFGNEITEFLTKGLPRATVEQQGLGYYVKITQPISEVSDAARDAIALTSNTKAPYSAWNDWIGALRSPEDTMSYMERSNRLQSVYGPSKLVQVLKDATKEIQSLKAGRFTPGPAKKRWDQFLKTVEFGAVQNDKNGKLGRFFDDIGDWEDNFYRVNKTWPDDQQTAAYFQFKWAMEADRAWREISEFKFRSRVGAENHTVSMLNANGEKVSVNFDGVVHKDIPGTGAGSYNVYISGARSGEEEIKAISDLTKLERDNMQAMMNSGKGRFIELYAPEHYPLQGFGSKVELKRVRYIFAENVETKPLTWDVIPVRGGGHVELVHEFYAGQAKMMQDGVGSYWWYNGDAKIAGGMSRAMMEDWAKHMTQIQKLLRDKDGNLTKDISAARAYSNTHMPENWNTIYSWFLPTKTPDGKTLPPRLSLDERTPIEVIEKNKSIGTKDNSLADRYGTMFKDGTREGSLARQYQVQYTAERDMEDLFAIRDIGTKGNPLYAIEPATRVDPLTTMNRGLQSIINSSYMDDYKLFAIEHWIQNSANYLKATPSELRYAPFYHFHNPQWARLDTKGMETRRNLELQHYNIQQLVGEPTALDSKLLNLNQKLVDTIWEKGGPKTVNILPLEQISKMQNPVTAIRSMVYHMKVGLLALPQWFINSAGYVNIYGIAPKYASQATFGAQLHYWTTINRHQPVMEALDTWASKFKIPGTTGYKPGWFLDAVKSMESTGFGIVGNERFLLDKRNTLVSSKWGNFLDWADLFAKSGDRNARVGAWHTAYLEWRAKHPEVVGNVPAQGIREILVRADDLTLNMSRASSAAWQKGTMSAMTQFYGYQARATELMMGKRLTPTERAGLFGSQAIVYGLPAALGLSGIPMAEFIRKWAIEGGYVQGDSAWESFLTEGGFSTLGAYITGEGNLKAGTFFNFADRYSVKGFDLVANVFRGNKPWWDLFGGAAYSTFKGQIESFDPFLSAVWSMKNADGKHFPLTMEDFVDATKEISSLNSAFGIIAAVQTKRALSKRGRYLADTTTGNAVFKAITGLQDSELNDMQRYTWSAETQKAFEKDGSKLVEKYFRRWLEAMKNKDYSAADKFGAQISARLQILGLRDDKINSLMIDWVKDNQSMVNRLKFDYYRNAPKGKEKMREEQLRKSLERRELRGIAQ